jgi:hypothetical protein
MRFLSFLSGLLFCGMGFQIYIQGGWWSPRGNMYIGYGDTKTPIGILAIIIGVLLCINAIFGKWKKPQVYICPECEEIVERSGDEVFCPKCGTKMEPLKGFYERHPELKGKHEKTD